ncbi:glycosyltransferase involved in cell wall biosynthesis [Actinoplanes teichomyceticus]|uniref:Glycosyltransferase involved in cell wall biosynthesis n=2 Tax=Actinoplanes teichomyceticus TaxID=1867 RepID=A0A561WKX9_ACTTI|nr:glycosyltransferase involved in cell wall biosynthesis [Actinoplanes teichomyceticus]
MVHTSFAVRGGAERYLRDLSAALVARGHDVAVYARPSAHGEPGDRPIRTRVSDRAPGPLRKLATHLGDLADRTGLHPGDLREFAPDVVHVHNWQGIGMPAVTRLAAAYPVCHSVHDMAICDPNNALGNTGRSRALDALLAARAAALVRGLRRVRLLLPAERTRATLLRLVPSAAALDQRVVPLSTPVPPDRRALPPGDRSTFLYLGALAAHKGVTDLLDAWSASPLRARGTLLIGGDGPLRARVEAAAAAHPSVRYLGYLDSDGKREALRQAGWLVFPSRVSETYGLVCAEALIAGRPILASAAAAPVMAAPGSYLLFDGAAALRGRLEEAAGLPADRYTALAASARSDGARLDWDAHVDAVLHEYTTPHLETSRS